MRALGYDGEPITRPGALIIDRSDPRPAPRWTRIDTVALVAITLAAAVLRWVSLGRPVELVFDEIFYARDACWYVLGTESACGITDLASRAHPPLGKWMIGAGIAVFGYDPFGWRAAVAAAGTMAVPLVHVLAWRLLRGHVAGIALTVGAAAAAGFLAIDLLHLVHSRVAMLDALIVLFVVAAVLAAVLDRDRPSRPDDPPWWWRLTLGRPWLLAAGAAIGAAAAVKWSGAYVAAGIGLLVVAWAVLARRRAEPAAGWRAWVASAFRREAVPVVLFLGLVPVLVYVASYTGRMPGAILALPTDPGSVWYGIWQHQRAMLDFHTSLGGDHPYQSAAWSWPFLQRPVAYWFSDEGGTYREILALGSPVAWWPALGALGALGVTWWRAGLGAARPEPVILAAAAATYLPWLVLSGDRSQTFLWYLLPTIPFLGLAAGTVAAFAWQRARWSRIGVGAIGLTIVAAFVFWLPLATALPLEPDAWRTRIVATDCERPDGSAPELPDDSTSQGEPPEGWCWI